MLVMEEDIRWIQRFSNYKKAYTKLNQAVESNRINDLSELEKEGLIQRFEYTHELAWNVMKNFLEYEGITAIIGSRSATRQAFAKGIIMNGEGWRDMIHSRNLTSHPYNEVTAEEIVVRIIDTYNNLFSQFQVTMEGFIDKKQGNIFL